MNGLGIEATDLGGHSYGAWIALHHALHAPGRVRRLFLLDPTQCFAGFKGAYLLRALPMPLRPTPRRVRVFLDWETGPAPLDADWLTLREAAVGFPARRPVTGPRPAPEALRALAVPVLLLLAENSRTHDPAEVAARAKAVLPHVETAVLPDVSLPHSRLRSSGVTPIALPQPAPPELGRRLGEFLAGPGD